MATREADTPIDTRSRAFPEYECLGSSASLLFETASSRNDSARHHASPWRQTILASSELRQKHDGDEIESSNCSRCGVARCRNEKVPWILRAHLLNASSSIHQTRRLRGLPQAQ